jgi:hypothetical protein
MLKVITIYVRLEKEYRLLVIYTDIFEFLASDEHRDKNNPRLCGLSSCHNYASSVCPEVEMSHGQPICFTERFWSN